MRRTCSTMHRELLRFLLVGGFCTLLQYLVLVAGVELAEHAMRCWLRPRDSWPAPSVNYLLNRRYTWASNVAAWRGSAAFHHRAG